MKFKAGDRVRNTVTGESGRYVETYEEAMCHFRLDGDERTHFQRIDNWEVETEPVPASVVVVAPAVDAKADAKDAKVEADPFPFTPPGPEMAAPARGSVLPKRDAK